MIDIEIKEYKKAYVELIEIIKIMSKEEKEKIPQSVINNLEKEKDNEYKYKYDESKNLQGQNLKTETKALLVEIYEKYLAPEQEKEIWKKYDKFCLNRIEEKKKIEYNPENLFKKKNKDHTNDNLPMIIEKKNIFISFLERIKKFLSK